MKNKKNNQEQYNIEILSNDEANYALDATRDERNQRVVRSVYLIQHAQYTLSLSEQRFLLYCISKVKPNDTAETEYTIQLKDYLQVCGLRGATSYSGIKNQIVETMRQMVLGMEETDAKGKKTFTVYNWFSKMAITQGSGVVKFAFTPDIAHHLIGIAQYNAHTDKRNQLYYISDELKYMLPFKCRYSYYLYPLLRSYQNRTTWTFPMDELRQQLDVFERLDNPSDYRSVFDPKSAMKRKPIHERFGDFRRYVLDPAVADINNYSNIKCAYRPEKRGNTVVAITFIFENKNDQDKVQSERRGRVILDRTDEFTQVTNRDVPDPEDPLEFTEAYKTGKDTNPPSIRVKKKTPDQIYKESMTRVKQAMADAGNKEEPSKPIKFGKKGARTANKNMVDLDVDTIFPVDRDKKAGKYQWKLENIRNHGNWVGGKYGEWIMDATSEEVANLLRFSIDKHGSLRLQDEFKDGKVDFITNEIGIEVHINGKTTALDMSKFTHRVFSSPSELNEIMTIYQENQKLS